MVKKANKDRTIESASKAFCGEIEIPGGVDVRIEGDKVFVSGEKGCNERVLRDARIKIEKGDKSVFIKLKEGLKFGKKDKMMINTFSAHIRNLVDGARKGYVGKLKICSGHFPMAVGVEGRDIVIKNFFGERVPRRVRVMEGVNVKVEGDIIVVKGVDKEKVGQSMARIEQATRITNRDRRIFMDGIWITSKPEVEK